MGRAKLLGFLALLITGAVRAEMIDIIDVTDPHTAEPIAFRQLLAAIEDAAHGDVHSAAVRIRVAKATLRHGMSLELFALRIILDQAEDAAMYGDGASVVELLGQGTPLLIGVLPGGAVQKAARLLKLVVKLAHVERLDLAANNLYEVRNIVEGRPASPVRRETVKAVDNALAAAEEGRVTRTQRQAELALALVRGLR